jgi:serine/threonine protein kinase
MREAALVAEAHGGSRELVTVAPGTLAVGAEIGNGRFKRVHRGWHRRFGAVVVLRFDAGHDANELSILKLFANNGGCQNIPKVLGLCGARVIQEYALWGSLKGALQNQEVQIRLSPAHKRCIALQIARAGAFLEEMRIVHADLSCRNILLFWLEDEAKFTIAKVSDFGLAVLLPEGCEYVQRKQPQATRWCSPETVAHMTLSPRSDMWSLGATLWELFSNGTAPWSRRSRRSDVAARLRDLAENQGAAEGGMDVSADFVLHKSTCGSCIQNIILSCLQANEHVRPSFAHLVRSLMQVSQVAPAPPARDIEDIEEKPSTPSTTDSVESIVSDEKAAEAIATRFKKIKDFLMTPPALMALGEDSVQEMLRELEEAQAREARYVSCLESARAGSEVTTAAGSSIPSLEGLMSHVALLGSSDSLPSCRATPSLGSSQVAVASAHVSEYVVPLVNSGGRWIETKRLPAPEQNAWTLTSYVSPALRRKDYASAEAAWAAYADEKGSPCVLRGPAGVEAAVRAWVPSQLAKIRN